MARKKNTKGVVEGKGTKEIREFTPKMIKGIQENPHDFRSTAARREDRFGIIHIEAPWEAILSSICHIKDFDTARSLRND